MAVPRQVWGPLSKRKQEPHHTKKFECDALKPVISVWDTLCHKLISKGLSCIGANQAKPVDFDKCLLYIFITTFQFYVVILSIKIQIYLNIMNS